MMLTAQKNKHLSSLKQDAPLRLISIELIIGRRMQKK